MWEPVSPSSARDDLRDRPRPPTARARRRRRAAAVGRVLARLAVLVLAGCSDGDGDGDGGADAAVELDAAVDAADAGGSLCGDTQPLGEDDVASGTRLCARCSVGDGARRCDGFHDALLGLPCQVSLTSQGYRCLSGARAATVFTDGACTQPLFETLPGPSCEPPPARLSTASNACEGPVIDRLYRPGPVVTPSIIYESSGGPVGTGSCVRSTTVPGATYRAAVDVSLADYVRFDLVEEPGPARLHARRLVGSDGSSFPSSLLDTALASTCVATSRGTTHRCRPDAVHASLRADESCATPLLPWLPACPAPRFIDERGALFATEPTPQPSNWYVPEFPQACAVEPAIGGLDYYTAGAELPDEDQVELTLAPRDTGGRLQPMAYAAPGFSRDTPLIFDRTLQTPCVPARAADDSLRCRPPPCYVEVLNLYADDACTQRVAGMKRFVLCLVDPPLPLMLRSLPPDAACTTGGTTWRRGALLTDPIYVRLPGGECTPNTSTTPLYALGAELTPDEMAPMTELAP